MDQKKRPSIDEIARLLDDEPGAIEIRPDGEVRCVDPRDRAAPAPLVLKTRGIGDNY